MHAQAPIRSSAPHTSTSTLRNVGEAGLQGRVGAWVPTRAFWRKANDEWAEKLEEEDRQRRDRQSSARAERESSLSWRRLFEEEHQKAWQQALQQQDKLKSLWQQNTARQDAERVSVTMRRGGRVPAVPPTHIPPNTLAHPHTCTQHAHNMHWLCF